eukprot:6620056-Prymnesium_polylepis.1
MSTTDRLAATAGDGPRAATQRPDAPTGCATLSSRRWAARVYATWTAHGDYLTVLSSTHTPVLLE